MAYSKEARDHAKANKLALFAVEVDGRPAKDGVTGRYASDGPLDCRMARSLFFFCLALSHDKPMNPAKAFAKYFPGGKPAPIPAPNNVPARNGRAGA